MKQKQSDILKKLVELEKNNYQKQGVKRKIKSKYTQTTLSKTKRNRPVFNPLRSR